MQKCPRSPYTLSDNVERLVLFGSANINGTGTALADLLYGNSGNNVLAGSSGGDILSGGGGIDTASYASASVGVTASLINASMNTYDAAGDRYSSIENLTGSSFADRLYGNSVANQVTGGAGDDLIVGGRGIDKLNGGAGADTFIFVAGDTGKTASTADIIYDFTSADTINLSGMDAISKTSRNDDFDFLGAKSFTKHAGQLRFEKSSSDTWIYGDTNGDGKPDFVIHLDDAVAMKAGYFDL